MTGFARVFSLCAAVVAAAVGSTSVYGGTVMLTNGDKLTGQIEKIGPESVEIVTTFAGKVTVQRAAVKAMWSEAPVTVVAADGATRQAYVAPNAEGAGWVETQVVAAAPEVVPMVMKPAVPPVKVLDLEHYGLPIGPHWKNSLTIGLVNTTGNTESTTFAGEAAFGFKSGPHDLGFRFGGEYGVTEGVNNAARFYNDVIYKRALPEWHADRWFFFAESHNVYDGIKGISLRSQNGLGFGYQLVKTEKLEMDLRAGPGFTYERFFDGTSHCDPTGLVGFHAAYIVNERTTLTQDILYTNGLTDLERYQLTSETALTIKMPELMRGAGLKFLFRDDYDSSTKSPAKNNDTRLMLGLTLDY